MSFARGELRDGRRSELESVEKASLQQTLRSLVFTLRELPNVFSGGSHSR